jgi:hypothetical protein
MVMMVMIWTLINSPGNDRPQRRIQDYLADNVYLTISGDFSVPALMMHPAGNGQRPGGCSPVREIRCVRQR